MIDGQPIVVIATLYSENVKTGDMIQTWILRDDVSPIAAIHNGDDYSICGNCPHRGTVEDGRNKRRSCYVKVANAPRGVWAAYKAGRYVEYSPRKHAKLFRGRDLRLGAYGDPTAAPLKVWLPILKLVNGHTGYTHQWRTCDPRWAQFIMASTESVEQTKEARAAGWRTFRMRTAFSPLMPNEVVCPAFEEGGQRKQCIDCLGCHGGSSRTSFAIIGHGSLPVLYSLVGRIS